MRQKPKARSIKKKETKKETQKERFIEAARKLGSDETGAAFERALSTIIPPKLRKRG